MTGRSTVGDDEQPDLKVLGNLRNIRLFDYTQALLCIRVVQVNALVSASSILFRASAKNDEARVCSSTVSIFCNSS